MLLVFLVFFKTRFLGFSQLLNSSPVFVGFLCFFFSFPPPPRLVWSRFRGDFTLGPRRREALLGGGPAGVPVCAVRAKARSVRHVRGRNEEEAQQHQAVSDNFNVFFTVNLCLDAFFCLADWHCPRASLLAGSHTVSDLHRKSLPGI